MRIKEAIETAANVFIVVTCIFFAATFATVYWRTAPAVSQAPSNQGVGRARAYATGDRLTFQNLQFARAERTIVMVFRSGCRFCTESMPFYQRLARHIQDSSRRVQLVGLTTDLLSQGKSYLDSFGLSVASLVSTKPESLGVSGTPTLLLVDSTGTIHRIWRGKLSASVEAEVLSEVILQPLARR